MQRRNLIKAKRGIDTIVASLLMVVIVVIASFMVYAYATGLLGALMVAPTNVAKETISLEYASFSSNNTVSLYVRNTGASPVTLTSYYVKDINGNQYAKTNWTPAPSMSPTTLGNATIYISSACTTGCTTTGTPFTFQAGNAYTITLVTSRNGAFPFTVVR